VTAEIVVVDALDPSGASRMKEQFATGRRPGPNPDRNNLTQRPHHPRR